MKNKKIKLFLLILLMVIIIPPIGLTQIYTSELPSQYNEIKNLNRVIIIQDKPDSFEDDFILFSSIPANIFTTQNGSKYLGPIIKDDLDYTSQYFLEDWKKYCDQFGGISQTIVMGNITTNTREILEHLLDQRVIPQLDYENIFSFSSKLANFDWVNSDIAVLSIIGDPNSFTTEKTSNISTYSFKNVVSNTSIIFNSTISGSDWNYSFPITDNVGWIAAYIDWDKDNLLTHQIIDPTGFIIDNTTIYTAKYTKSLGNQELVSILPNSRSGVWNLTIRNESIIGEKENFILTLKQYPGIRGNITVEPNTLWLNLSLSWLTPYTNLDLIAISPSGRIVDWDIDPNQIYSNRSVSIPFPESGIWEFLVAWWGGSGSINFDLKTDIEIYDSDLFDSIYSSANGAIIASINNAPLLYSTSFNLTQEVINTLNSLNVKNIIISDINNRSSPYLINQINNISTIENHFTNFTQIFNYVNSYYDKDEIIITYPLEDYCSFSSILAAAQDKPILMIPNTNITSLSKSAWAPLKMNIANNLKGLNEHPEYFEGNYLDEGVPKYYSMVEISKEFDKIINNLGLNENLTITVIASEKIIPVSFERSIIGKYIVGRISNSREHLDGVIIRTIFRDTFISSKSQFNSLLTFYAYSYGANFTDNNNLIHEVFNRDNISTLLNDENFYIENHTGINQIINNLKNGTDLWIISTHSFIDITGIRGKSAIIFRDIDNSFWFEPGGTLEEPDSNKDGVVDPFDWISEQYRFMNLDRIWFETNLNKLDNTMIIFTTCLMGPSFSNLFLDKGGIFTLGSYRTVSFNSGTWFNYLVTKNFLENNSIGEALKAALINSSTIYSLERRSEYGNQKGDFSLQFVLYGDPTIKLQPEISNKNLISFESFEKMGHSPSKGIGLIGILGIEDYLTKIIDNININYNFSLSYNFINITEVNIEDFIRDLEQYQTIIIGSDAVIEINKQFINHSDYIESYIQNGGSIIIFNSTEPLLWTPLRINNTVNETGSTINFNSDPYPLKNYPIVLGNTYFYNAIYSNFSNSFDVIASGNLGPVWLAANYNSGKISVLSMEVDKLNYSDIILNLLIWPNLKGLKAEIITDPNSPIIYLGDRILVIVNVTDIFGWPIENASIKLILNEEEINLFNTSNNQFIFDITENISIGTTNLNILVWKIDAEPDNISYSFEIRNRQWLLIGLGIFIVISMSGYIAFKMKNFYNYKRTKRNEKIEHNKNES